MKFKRYPDGCYAVVRGSWRGPCAHDQPTALTRWIKRGRKCLARSNTGH